MVYILCMYNVYTAYITAFRLLECKAIFSRGASTRQRPFSENVHLPKVGTVKSVSKSVPQHYSAAAPFSKDRQLNRFGQLLPRNDATRRPAPIPNKLITPNQTRLRKVVSRHRGGARPPYIIGTARLEFSIVIVLSSTSLFTRSRFLRHRGDASRPAAKQVHSARVGKTDGIRWTHDVQKYNICQERSFPRRKKRILLQKNPPIIRYSGRRGDVYIISPLGKNRAKHSADTLLALNSMTVS